jgi:hypothetical protein
MRIRWHGVLEIVLGPTPALLIGQRSPAPVGHRLVGLGAVDLVGVDALGPDGAEVLPVVAEVERVGELVTELEPAGLALRISTVPSGGS